MIVIGLRSLESKITRGDFSAENQRVTVSELKPNWQVLAEKLAIMWGALNRTDTTLQHSTGELKIFARSLRK